MQKSPADVIESGDKFSAFGVEATGQSSKEVLGLSLWERTMKIPVSRIIQGSDKWLIRLGH